MKRHLQAWSREDTSPWHPRRKMNARTLLRHSTDTEKDRHSPASDKTPWLSARRE